MNDLRKAAEMELKVLERASDAGYSIECEEAITTLRQALAQPEPFTLVCPTCNADRTKEACKGDLLNCWLKGYAQSAQPEQEPVAWWSTLFNVTYIPPENFNVWESNAYKAGQLQPLYSAPPSKPWVSLTDEKLDEIVFDCGLSATPKDIARAIEAALRSKNNG